MASEHGYSLALTEREIARYRFMAERARLHEADLWTSVGIVAGASVADIGCGPGLVLLELADVVGPSGHVVGVDREPDAIAHAQQIVAGAGLTHVEVRQGPAAATGLEPESFDVVSIRQVLAHNTEAERVAIVAHALDLLRPDGAIYVVDTDLSAVRFDPPDADLVHLLASYNEHLEAKGTPATVGPNLGSLLLDAGVVGIERQAELVTSPGVPGLRPPAWAAREAIVASGHATAADVERWDAALSAREAAAAAGGAQVAQFLPLYRTSGRKPH